jgi:microcystin-dependent protein
VSSPFLGQIIPVGFNFAPRGWAFCNGQTLAINQNQALFSLVGTTYGGDGVQTFRLPNLQSQVAVHAGQGIGLSDYQLGQTAGVPSVTITSQTIAAHAHQVSQPASKDEETTNRPDGAYFTAGGAYGGSPSGPAMAGTETSATGGSQPHSNLQPTLSLTFVIALTGIFPSRS